jgi:Flp pilus assembly protein TadG
MLPRSRSRPRTCRRAAAAVELVLLAPMLLFLCVVASDYARIFYHCQVVANCARNGALYGCSDPTCSTDTSGIQAAALTDASDLSPAPAISSTTGSDSDGNYIEVTASYTFHTLANYPGLPTTTTITRTVRMRVTPVLPDFS